MPSNDENQEVAKDVQVKDTSATTAAVSIAKKQEAAIQESLIYCGPNLPRGLFNQFTVVQNGLSAHLSKHVEACPAIRRLCVPVAQFAQTEQAIQQAGSAEHVWYQQIVQYAQGGAKA